MPWHQVVAAHQLYPGSVCVLPEPQNPNVRSFISPHKNLFNVSRPEDIDVNRFTRLIVVDTNRWSRLGGLDQFEDKKDPEIQLFDHHGSDGCLNPMRKRSRRAVGGCPLIGKAHPDDLFQRPPLRYHRLA